MAKPYGLLAVGFNYSNAPEEEFNAWYDTEHIPERLRVKGFINAERWLGADDPKISFATYDLKSLDVLKTKPYLAIAYDNLSPWSKRVTGKCQRLCRFEVEQTLPGRQAAPDNAPALMMFATNVAPEVEAEFNDWYTNEHIPRLLKVPGCYTARRFVTNGGTHKHVAIYHLASPEVCASQAWKEAAGTPWTDKLRPQFRDVMRLVFRRYTRKV